MNIITTPLNNLLVIEPRVFEDSRGYFFEGYNKEKLNKEGIQIDFVQDNQSRSAYGVVRGLHFQRNPKAQAKLVRVIEGTIYDVAVDCRKGSPSFGKWHGVELSANNKKQLLVPEGFAHGFSVLSENATVFYKCNEFYAPEYDAGIAYNDTFLNIDWRVPETKMILSEKDRSLPDFNNASLNFEY